MLKFPKVLEKKAKSVDEAKAQVLEELGVSEDEIEIEVVEEGKKGLLGLGSKEAVISVTLKNPEIAMAKKFLGDIFKSMKLDVQIEAEMTEEDVLTVNLIGENMGIVIGKRGDTLDSLQYLTSIIINKDSEKYIKVTVDAENYREKRYNSLIALASRLADKVARTGRRHTLEPMNPYERRIIHSSLQDNENVTTRSVGEDPYRKVVIESKNPRPSYRKSYPKHSSFETYVEAESEEI